MSVLETGKRLLARLRASEPEATDTVTEPTPPAYAVPQGVEVKIDKGWFILHRGLNRKARRETISKLKRKSPTVQATHRGFRPETAFIKRDKLKDRLKTTPSNFPVRKVFINGEKKFCFEPEYWELRHAYAELEKERRQKAVEAFKAAAEVESSLTYVPPVLDILGNQKPVHV